MNDKRGIRLTIRKRHYAEMLADVMACAPEEACGLVAGQNGCTDRVYVVTNALHSPTAFRMEAKEQVEAFLAMEDRDLELLAIYHSHPAGPNEPSETDRAEFAYPGVITLIWFPAEDQWECRAYRIRERAVEEIALELVDDL